MTKAEKYIQDYTRTCSNEIVEQVNGYLGEYNPWLTPDQARRAVEIAKEEAIEKAYKWLGEHAAYYCNANVPNREKDLIKDFRKFMED